MVIYSVGANRNIGKAYGMFMGEVLELVRVALNGKQEHTSQVVCFDKRLRRKFQKQAKPYPKDEDLQICSGQVEERASS